jgi:hypothetical protein
LRRRTIYKTGAVFDKIAKKFEGVAKAGKAFEGIKPPMLGKAGWGQSFQRDVDALRVSSKELAWNPERLGFVQHRDVPQWSDARRSLLRCRRRLEEANSVELA